MTDREEFDLSPAIKDNIIETILDSSRNSEEFVSVSLENLNPIEKKYYREILSVFASIGDVAPLAEPSPELKLRIFQALPDSRLASTGRIPTPSGGLMGHEGPWLDSGVPGISYRILFRNAVTQAKGMMLNIQAGATYPAHEHQGPEYFYLIEGDLFIEAHEDHPSITMEAGDFQFSKAGSHHGAMTSPSGCMAFVISSEARGGVALGCEI